MEDAWAKDKEDAGKERDKIKREAMERERERDRIISKLEKEN